MEKTNGDTLGVPDDRGIPEGWLRGSSVLGCLVREFDWSKTPLGAIEGWEQSLKTVVRVLLTSRFAMWMSWGSELTFLYNDAYAKMTLGKKHPWALGKRSEEVWQEIWSDIENSSPRPHPQLSLDAPRLKSHGVKESFLRRTNSWLARAHVQRQLRGASGARRVIPPNALVSS